EWVHELDRLQAALDPAAATVLAAARNPSWAKPQSKSKSKPKPKAKSKSKPKSKSKSKSKSR
ncbi:MAG TPA: hypothetical protein VL326_14385, partial [Kofleriaceae bacterium]|nr:hypothetical protein [Kofleriaceae bacterium]